MRDPFHVGWLTTRDPDAHECKPPRTQPPFAVVHNGDYWRCTCGALFELREAVAHPLRWKPAAGDPGARLRPIEVAPVLRLPPPRPLSTGPSVVPREPWWVRLFRISTGRTAAIGCCDETCTEEHGR